MMKVIKQITIDAPANRVWEVLGAKYDRVGEWASDVMASTGKPAAANTTPAPFAGRTCQTSMGAFNEDITVDDERNMRLAYNATGEKMPFFVKRLANNWQVTPIGQNRSRVDMRLEADLLPVFSLLMGSMIKMQFNKVTQSVVEELKYFVETGSPHPRKMESLEQVEAFAH